MGEELPYEVRISWARSGAEDQCDMIVRRRTPEGLPVVMDYPAGPSGPARTWTLYANNPLQGEYTQRLVPIVRGFLREQLQEDMVPSTFVLLDALPLTPNGKVDRQALPAPDHGRPTMERSFIAPSTGIEQTIAVAWQEVLGLEKVGVHDNFFDLGGHSMLMVRLYSKLREMLNHHELSIIDLFRYPTINSLAQYIYQGQSEPLALQPVQARVEKQRETVSRRQPHIFQSVQERAERQRAVMGQRRPRLQGRTATNEYMQKPQQPTENIAIIGMRGRFPGARNLDEFWQNLRDGVESISIFSDEELRAAGTDSTLWSIPGFVRAGGVLEDIDLFDAHFFGFNARDAQLLDPQQRLFLECAWESLELAGYNPTTYPGLIAVFAGADMSSYLHLIYANFDKLGYVDDFQLIVGNDKDHLTTHVSYKLNLRGPSIVVQTACSTSLVALCMACQSLLTYQSDMALAGGVTVSVPQKGGYFHQPGSIVSPDGHCRTFDAAAQGTVPGSGVGLWS